MSEPHYHPCTGDCPDGLIAGSLVPSNARIAAIEFFRTRLDHLARLIEEGRESRYVGIRAAAEVRVPERDHLAVLLGIFGDLGGAKTDVLLPDGTHRYWSTHCRHDRHADCSASEITGRIAVARLTHVATIERLPAQCKTCAAPCICPCHKSSTDEGAAA